MTPDATCKEEEKLDGERNLRSLLLSLRVVGGFDLPLFWMYVV